MNLFSASEDLAVRTLKHVHGTLRKLLYVVTLRDREGKYCHWGMARVFGQKQAASAVQQAHQDAMNEVLRKSLPELWAEVAGDDPQGATVKLQIQELTEMGRNVVPPGCSEAAECHLNAVLHALRELAQARAGTSNRPAA